MPRDLGVFALSQIFIGACWSEIVAEFLLLGHTFLVFLVWRN
jgi:hypothetical protein